MCRAKSTVQNANGRLAQLGEHLPYKQRVTGSSPVAPTISGPVVQLVRMPACHAGGHRFEPGSGRQIRINIAWWVSSSGLRPWVVAPVYVSSNLTTHPIKFNM